MENYQIIQVKVGGDRVVKNNYGKDSTKDLGHLLHDDGAVKVDLARLHDNWVPIVEGKYQNAGFLEYDLSKFDIIVVPVPQPDPVPSTDKLVYVVMTRAEAAEWLQAHK